MMGLRVRFGRCLWHSMVALAPCAVLVTSCGDGGKTNSVGTAGDKGEIARVEAAVFSVTTFSGLLTPAGSADLGDGGAAAVMSEITAEVVAGADVLPGEGGGATLNLACPGSGTAEVSCSVSDGHAIWRVVTSECRFCRLDGNRRCVIIDGSLTAALAGGSCELRRVREELATVNVQAEELSVDLTDADANVLAHVSANGTVHAESAGPGCLVPNGTLALDGSLDLVAPGRGVDVSFIAEGLSIVGGSDGSPCTVSGVIDGSLTVEDRGGARQFAGTFDAFAVGFTPVGNRSADVTVQGGLSSACLGGPVQLETEEPMRFTLGRICPAAGKLTLLSDDRQGSVAFTTTRGVEVDRDGDGVVDEVLASCTDASSGPCVGP